jgi:hypothetical protein
MGWETGIRVASRRPARSSRQGMTFLGHDLIRPVEEVLPAQFGGGPTDYQSVEVERGGLPGSISWSVGVSARSTTGPW